MNIRVTELIENPDGSADLKVELDADAHKIIIQEGFMSMIIKGIQMIREESQQVDEE
jgi:hypothetical protein